MSFLNDNDFFQEVPFFLHDLGEEELESVKKVLQGPILTTGSNVLQFEAQFAEFMNCKYAIGLNSCTGALHLALLELGIGEGD